MSTSSAHLGCGAAVNLADHHTRCCEELETSVLRLVTSALNLLDADHGDAEFLIQWLELLHLQVLRTIDDQMRRLGEQLTGGRRLPLSESDQASVSIERTLSPGPQQSHRLRHPHASVRARDVDAQTTAHHPVMPSPASTETSWRT